MKFLSVPNPAVNRTLRDKAAQHRLLLRWALMRVEQQYAQSENKKVVALHWK